MTGVKVFSLGGVGAPRWYGEHLAACRGVERCHWEEWEIASGKLIASGATLPEIRTIDGRYGAESVGGVFRLWDLQP